jgi:DNA mismatch endonuclease (patch repair protein)
MRAVPRRNTPAEQKLQSALRGARLRFQTHVPILGCFPDIVFRSARLVVFVDGDFWHGRLLIEPERAEAFRQTFRTASRPFWIAKLTRNVARDQRQTYRLRRNRWSVVRLWERDVLKNPRAAAALVAKRISDRKRRLPTSAR